MYFWDRLGLWLSFVRCVAVGHDDYALPLVGERWICSRCGIYGQYMRDER
jgi:hypothetical protein